MDAQNAPVQSGQRLTRCEWPWDNWAFAQNQLVRRRVTFDVMKHACSFVFALAGVAVATWMASCSAPSRSMTYPETRTVDVVDTLWGTAVADPYRWLEDDRDPEVMERVSAQASTARPTSTACLNERRCVTGARRCSTTRGLAFLDASERRSS